MKEHIPFSHSLQWVKITEPHENDIRELRKDFSVHPFVINELLHPSERSKLEIHDSYLLLVTHIPLYNHTERTSRKVEINIIVTKDTLITLTREPVEPLEQFVHIRTHKPEEDIESTAELLYYLLEELKEFSLRELRHIEEKINEIGANLFKHQDRALLEDISYIKRDLLNFSMIIAPQHATIVSLVNHATAFWGSRFEPYFNDLLGDTEKLHTLLDTLKHTIESYSETVSQLFELKTAEVVRRFSILGFLTFPLLLYATIALQPKVEATFIANPEDFWILFGIITLFITLLAVFFRKRGWL